MKHLSERHDDTVDRCGDLMRKQQSLSTKARSLDVNHRSSRRSMNFVEGVIAASEQVGAESKNNSRHDNILSNYKRRTPEELAEYSRLCEQRIANTRGKDLQDRQYALALERERQARSRAASEAAPAQAVQRLRKRREKLRRAAEAELEALVVQQESSLEAMNIVRMLSPRFLERAQFTPSIARYSAEDERIKCLLSSRNEGSYY
ncbi:hypothetical protein Plhal304r1_c002g0005051 [Plasmopara halstedii]